MIILALVVGAALIQVGFILGSWWSARSYERSLAAMQVARGDGPLQHAFELERLHNALAIVQRESAEWHRRWALAAQQQRVDVYHHTDPDDPSEAWRKQ